MATTFYDLPYHTFSFWSDMVVVCPNCGETGVVRFHQERNIAVFQCKSCYTKKETMPGGQR